MLFEGEGVGHSGDVVANEPRRQGVRRRIGQTAPRRRQGLRLVQEHLDALLDPRIRAYEKEKNKEVLSSFSMQVRGLDWDMAFRSILEQTW